MTESLIKRKQEKTIDTETSADTSLTAETSADTFLTLRLYKSITEIIDSGHGRYLMVGGLVLFLIALVMKLFFPGYTPMEFITMIISSVIIVISGAYFQSKLSQGNQEIAKEGSKIGDGNKIYKQQP